MASSEDPEARIRDMERGLGREATPQQWTDGEPPATPATGSDRRLVSRLLFWLGLVIIVLATAAYLAFGREPESPTPATGPVPTVSSATTTPFASEPPVNTGMPRPETTAHTIEATTPAGRGLTVSGVGQHQTLDCDGKAVDISGISNTVVLTGHCERVVVSGIDNEVAVDSAGAIEASGIRNRVTYHFGVPQVDISGDNIVQPG